MAVYTHLHADDLRRLARAFELGRLERARGIPAGTINTIYELRTDRGRYVLRILEDRSLRDARFEEALVTRLHERGLPVAPMVAGRGGARIVSLSARQHVSVFGWLPGAELPRARIGPRHTEQIGTFLARMHAATRGLRRRRANAFSPERCAEIAARCQRAIREEGERFDAAMRADLGRITRELGQTGSVAEGAAGAIVHGDLFTDNAHFVRDRLCGVLDFEMASSGARPYDVAVATCDWCFDGPRFDAASAAALLRGYAGAVPERREVAELYRWCRFAVARFALTRFYDFEVRVRPDAHRRYKDYRDYLARMDTLAELGPRGFAAQVEVGATARG